MHVGYSCSISILTCISFLYNLGYHLVRMVLYKLKELSALPKNCLWVPPSEGFGLHAVYKNFFKDIFNGWGLTSVKFTTNWSSVMLKISYTLSCMLGIAFLLQAMTIRIKTESDPASCTVTRYSVSMIRICYYLNSLFWHATPCMLFNEFFTWGFLTSL